MATRLISMQQGDMVRFTGLPGLARDFGIRSGEIGEVVGTAHLVAQTPSADVNFPGRGVIKGIPKPQLTPLPAGAPRMIAICVKGYGLVGQRSAPPLEKQREMLAEDVDGRLAATVSKLDIDGIRVEFELGDYGHRIVTLWAPNLEDAKHLSHNWLGERP